MKISCCMIVKDDSEVNSLSRALDSIQPYVDGVYITATGHKVGEIRKLCKKRGVNYSYFKWIKDFSAARNFNFAQAPKDSDFIWWMDADDILVGGEHLQEVAQTAKKNGKDTVFFTYWYGCGFSGVPSLETLTEVKLEQMRERLLKPSVHVWKGMLHETPIPVSGVKNNYTTYAYDAKERPLVVVHATDEGNLEEKMARNQEILEMQLEKERKAGGADPRTLLYLMKIYAEKDDPKLWDKCLIMGEEYLEKSGWNEERATCWENMGLCYQRQEKFDEAIKCYHRAIEEYPRQPLLYLRLATVYYILKKYDYVDHWMNLASQMSVDKVSSNLTNVKAMKLMLAELLLKMNYNVYKNTKNALEAAELLYKEMPTEEHSQQVAFLESVDRLNDACGQIDKVCEYLSEIGEAKSIVPLLETLPDAISTQPFAIKLRHKFSAPRKWGRNEVCYFANFGSKHFEQWDSSSLNSGIGGSESAVIELSKEWTKMGYKVTVYGDPFKKGTDEFGITWLPYYYFNPKDSFNIFIQWRGWFLADKIKSRKFFVDLHDVWNSIDVTSDQLQAIDKFMIKSEYHRSLGADIPDNKFLIIGNGVRV